MKDAWSYGTTVKPPDASTASLALRATAPVPATADTVLASDQVDLRTQIYADGAELGARSLLGSVVVEEIKSWLIKVLPSTASTSTAPTLIELTSSDNSIKQLSLSTVSACPPRETVCSRVCGSLPRLSLFCG